MKRIFLSLVFLLIYSVFTQAMDDKEYKDCIRNFYKVLFENNDSIKGNLQPFFRDNLNLNDYFKKIKKHKTELSLGYNQEKIDTVIANCKPYSEDYLFGIAFDLIFPNNKIICFEMNSELPVTIEYIWLSNGDLLEDVIFNRIPEKLCRVGIINDNDGYVNIRALPDKKSKIVLRLLANETFYYTPIGDEDWWLVYKERGGKSVGYIHKSRVLRFSDFPIEIKEKYRKGK